ncbi:hypothetical protein [Vibrio parahaemolyticus]|uniref:hypothetical protein n=1 Tax=Vibrio parahaemolyticus TaxID=670 RepID=UPI0027E4F5F7|nr:hypothetical protein [Vibrio parahaemolyticus]WMN84135.1 hypothetical protein NI384_06470 [Vibrio parahaemolyticus]
MGNFNLNSGQIQAYNVQVVTENHPNGAFDVIHLSITSEYHIVNYRICNDERHPDLKVIEQNLLQGLTAAHQGSGDFGINEYLERSYIFVNYPNGSTAQYTANRI